MGRQIERLGVRLDGQYGPGWVNGTGMSTDKPRVVVVMPAYNAARTLEKTTGELPKHLIDKVILVDDASQDDTPAIAQRLGLETIVHVQNKGYGGNQKTCYIEALSAGADVVVMVHPDNQYDATRIPKLIRPIIEGEADLVLGSRILYGRDLALKGGMPVWKYIANRFLTLVENVAFGTNMSEAHTGLRAYSRRLLTTIPFLLNSDDFVFDTEVIAETVAFGFKIGEVAVPTRYFPEASSVNFQRSVVYGLGTLNVVRKFLLNKLGIRRYAIFRKPLARVVSRYHRARIFGGNPSPPPASLMPLSHKGREESLGRTRSLTRQLRSHNRREESLNSEL